MADLRTSYMGIELENPIVVGACSLSKKIDTIKKIEDAGAGGLVLKSLFEEQIQLERVDFEDELTQHDGLYAEAVQLFPTLEHGGASEFLYWVERARKAVKLPLFGSLNAVNPEIWIEYAKRLEGTGVDGIELNFYSLSLDRAATAADIENRDFEIFVKVREAVKLPLSVKLHPYYTNLMNVATRFDKLGADAIVVFNRFWQPNVNVELEEEQTSLVLSGSADSLPTLRWTSLLHRQIEGDLVSNSGIMDGEDMIKMLLAGANAVQVVSTLYKNNVSYIGELVEQLSSWMERKGYDNLDRFRGKLGKQNLKNPWSFERGQYIKGLLGFD